MMKHMGRTARTDYDWGQPLAEKIHAELIRTTPVDRIPERQAWRNEMILATRKMQQDPQK